MKGNEYIWVDVDGKELRREPKGRGRPRKGSVEREPGKFYIVEGEIKKTKPQEPSSVSLPKDNEDNEEVEESLVDGFGQPVIKRKKTRTKVSKEKMTIEAFAANCKPISWRCEDDYLYILDRVIIVGHKMEYPDIMFNSVFVKIVLNDRDKSITLYITDKEYPSLILSGALI